MNTQPSPLVPQGQLLDSKNKGRARVKIAVFFVLAIHGIGLMALLMQGCRREEPAQQPPVSDIDTNALMAPTLSDTNTVPVDTNYVAPGGASAVDTNIPADSYLATTATNVLAGPAAGASEYKVVKGDSFYTIGKKFGVSTKAIVDANPGVDPSKLQPGQTLKIPAPTVAAPAASPAANGTATAANGEVYTVRSGDNLTKIAKNYGVTVKALRSANNLTTDRITVGQKLKIPAKSAQ